MAEENGEAASDEAVRSMMRIIISSGHGKYVRGASGYIDEVDEARAVVEKVASYLQSVDVSTRTYHDNVSRSQSENLTRIVDFHNAQTRDLDCSIHFNAYSTTASPRGTECLFVTQKDLAALVAEKVSAAGDLINRGAKARNDLYFLNNTSEPAILIEVCFVDSSTDVNCYTANFDAICRAIAEAISGISIPAERPEDLPPPGEAPEDDDEPTPAYEPPTVAITTTGDVLITINGQPIRR